MRNLTKHSRACQEESEKSLEENAGERPRIIEREIEVAPVLDEQEQQQREQRIRRKLRREGISY